MDINAILRGLQSAAQQGAGRGNGYVQLARRVYLTGDGVVHVSEPVSMEGYNAVFVECTAFVFTGFDDPTLNLTVQVSNDKQNWTTLPVGGSPEILMINTVGYFKLDQGTIGQQVSAAWVRLRYETTGDIEAICSIGIERKRLGA